MRMSEDQMATDCYLNKRTTRLQFRLNHASRPVQPVYQFMSAGSIKLSSSNAIRACCQQLKRQQNTDCAHSMCQTSTPGCGRFPPVQDIFLAQSGPAGAHQGFMK